MLRPVRLSERHGETLCLWPCRKVCQAGIPPIAACNAAEYANHGWLRLRVCLNLCTAVSIARGEQAIKKAELPAVVHLEQMSPVLSRCHPFQHPSAHHLLSITEPMERFGKEHTSVTKLNSHWACMGSHVADIAANSLSTKTQLAKLLLCTLQALAPHMRTLSWNVFPTHVSELKEGNESEHE